MARPIKQGLDYLNLDLDMDTDDKMYMVQADHGWLGIMIVIKILMEIYRDGYFLKWHSGKAKVFATKNRFPLDVVEDVVKICLKEDFFTNKLFDSHGIITSNGIQKRYFNAIKRRKEVNAIQEYLLIPERRFKSIFSEKVKVVINSLNDDINVDINPVNQNINADINPAAQHVNDDSNQQSKEKKVKKSKVKNNSAQARVDLHKKIINYLNKICKTKYRYKSKGIKEFINGRLNEGFVYEDFKTVINKKHTHWANDPENCQYLTPYTLFRPTKFEIYLNQVIPKSKNINNNLNSSKTTKEFNDFRKQLDAV